jgi:lysophospholipase L1-like esterase
MLHPFRLVALAAFCLSVATVTRAAEPAASDHEDKPTLFLIGDSTVKNGSQGLKGWGEVIEPYFDTSKINIVNAAIGGRSSRSFLTEGRWDKVMSQLKPGDFVLMQFGHNDGGKLQLDPKVHGTGRASIHGTGDETQEVTDPTTGKKETVHTFGWYMKQYVEGAKSKGATPIVCSLIPRNDWKDGKVLRADQSYGKWAQEVAEQEHVPFINLNEIIGRRYDQLGQDKVKEFFPQEHTHTNAAGADLNAQCVVAGIKGLKDVPLKQYLSARGQAVKASDAVVEPAGTK